MANLVNDPNLVEAQRGNGDAYAQLVEPALPVAYRVAFGMLMNRDDALDAVQEATVRAWRRIGNVKPGLPFYPWYLGIVTRECRRAARFRWRYERAVDDSSLAADQTAGVAQALDIRMAMRKLSPPHRQVVLLHFYADLTLEQVGLVTGTPLGTVKSRLNRALEQLRGRLGDGERALEVKRDA